MGMVPFPSFHFRSIKEFNMPSKTYEDFKFKIPREEINKIIIRVNKFFANNKKLFLKNATDFEDLLQEIYIVMLETERKFTNKDISSLIKLTHLAVGWKLHNLVDFALKNALIYNNKLDIDLDTTLDNVYIDNKYTKREKEREDNIFNILSSLSSLLSTREYNIINKIIVDNKTNEEVATDLHISKQRVNIIYLKAIKKIKQKLLEMEE